MTEWDIKWVLTWENFILYMASIPSIDSEDEEPKIKTKNAADIF